MVCHVKIKIKKRKKKKKEKKDEQLGGPWGMKSSSIIMNRLFTIDWLAHSWYSLLSCSWVYLRTAWGKNCMWSIFPTYIEMWLVEERQRREDRFNRHGRGGAMESRLCLFYANLSPHITCPHPPYPHLLSPFAIKQALLALMFPISPPPSLSPSFPPSLWPCRSPYLLLCWVPVVTWSELESWREFELPLKWVWWLLSFSSPVNLSFPWRRSALFRTAWWSSLRGLGSTPPTRSWLFSTWGGRFSLTPCLLPSFLSLTCASSIHGTFLVITQKEKNAFFFKAFFFHLLSNLILFFWSCWRW